MAGGVFSKHTTFQFKLEDGSLIDYIKRKKKKIKQPKKP